jgi:hypothetical protein
MNLNFAGPSSDGGHGHAVERPQIALTRREFLKGAGILTGSLAASSILGALAPSLAWAVETKVLTSAQGDALLQMGKVLYPHKGLPDAVYALLVKDLDGTASDAQKLAAVKSLEGTPFFGKVRGQCITSLYDNDMAWSHFGYPGASWDKGGYITRGFNDLKWLPNPPASASPPPYMG